MAPDPPYARSDVTDIVMKGTLRKAKSWNKRYFVLRETTPPVLEYYDSEKKWQKLKTKRTIEISKPWNISRKKDGKHNYLITIFTEDNYFSMAADNADSQEKWMNALNHIAQPEPGRALFQNMWHVVLDNKELISVGDSKHHLLTGPYRCCLKHDGMVLVRVNASGGRDRRSDPIEVQIASIRMCGHYNNSFFFDAGRLSGIGEGKLWMDVNDEVMAKQMHEIVNSSFKQNGPRNRTGSSGSNAGHPRHHNPPPSLVGLNQRSNNTSQRSRCQSLPACQPYFNDSTNMRGVRTSSEGEKTGMRRPPTSTQRCRQCTLGKRCSAHRAAVHPAAAAPSYRNYQHHNNNHQQLEQQQQHSRLPHEPPSFGSMLASSSNSSGNSSTEQLHEYTAMSFCTAAAAPVSGDQHPISMLASHSDHCIDEPRQRFKSKRQDNPKCLRGSAGQRCISHPQRSVLGLCSDCLRFMNVVGSSGEAPPPPDVQPSSLKQQQHQRVTNHHADVHVRASSFDGVIPQSPDSLWLGDRRAQAQRASMQSVSYSPEPSTSGVRGHGYQQQSHPQQRGGHSSSSSTVGADGSPACGSSTPISTSPKRDARALLTLGSDDEYSEPMYPHQLPTSGNVDDSNRSSKKVVKQHSSSSLTSKVHSWFSQSSSSSSSSPPQQDNNATAELSPLVAPGYVPMRPQNNNGGASSMQSPHDRSKPAIILGGGNQQRRSSFTEAARGGHNLSSSGEQQQTSSLHHKPRSGTVTPNYVTSVRYHTKPQGRAVLPHQAKGGANNYDGRKSDNGDEYLEMSPLNAVENQNQKQKERSSFLMSSANRRKNSSVGFELDSYSKKKLPPQYPHHTNPTTGSLDDVKCGSSWLEQHYKQQQQQQQPRGSRPRTSASFSVSSLRNLTISPQRSQSIRIPPQPPRHVSMIRTVAPTTNQTSPRNESSNSDEYVDIMIKQPQHPRTGSAPGVRPPHHSETRVGANSR